MTMRRAPSPMPYLVVREPGQVSYTLPLQEDLRLGRSEQNDVVLDDHQVSRFQARFTRSEQGWSVEDLGSMHGTLVNTVRITTHLLKVGDRIQVGNTLLVFREDAEPELAHQQATAAFAPLRDDSDRRLQLVYELSRAAFDLAERDDLLGRVLQSLLDALGCERALVGLAEPGARGFRRLARTREGGPGADDIAVSRTLLEAVTVRRESVIFHNTGERGAPKTLVREGILTAMAVPLHAGSLLLGFLYVDARQRPALFTPQDLDFLTAIGHLVAAALESGQRYRRMEALTEALGPGGTASELIGASEPMLRLKRQIQRYGASAAHVFIQGESGTGKELVARALHGVSPRAAGPFVTLNCAAIPESMVESELFGHERGAFTGAVGRRRGKFVMADGGTLFLDEIGDLHLSAQATLLRALQEGEIHPLGAERPVRVSVRVVSATHKDLAEEIENRRFREDLYYRLNVVELSVPPLRERGDDIELLARALLRAAASSMGKREMEFTPAALAALKAYGWPGNVRELRNEMERAAIDAELPIVDLHNLSSRICKGSREAPAAREGMSLAEQFAALDSTERRLIEEALKAARGNLSEAARQLGITRVMIKRRIDRFGLGFRDE
ncbi:sigma 54-interacting transcriptional regulator [Sorangium sp. So ce375]|uniref:sigma 54-interacting transcriptional regulator n=1 Tax=Sorangium sp. So ce375 TaxID=3133306 RepID=UPI003F5CB8E3